MSVSDTDVPVKSLTLEEFLDFIYGDNTGYAYSPIKNPVTGEWSEDHFFLWPEQKEKLVKHINVFTKTHEVYYSPALFSQESRLKKYYKASTVLWTEFDIDDEAIEKFKDIPQPTLKIQSSTPGHEHWYWKLGLTIPDEDILEDLNKRITYATGTADKSVWNCNKVLRPIGTTHHESTNKVKLIEYNGTVFGPQHFIELPSVPNEIAEFTLGRLPQLVDVMALYLWKREDLIFFKKAEQPKGSRSSALARLGYTCMEMGMTNEESFIVLQNADGRWGKFKDRSDQEHRLVNLIKHCRIKHLNRPKKEEPEKEKLTVYSYKDFKQIKENIDWITPGYFFKKGVAIVGGPPDVGKTQFTIRTAMHMALGKKFLNWEMMKPLKCMFFSLEMPNTTLRFLTDTMDENLTVAEMGKLEERLFVWPEGYGLRLDDPEDQKLVTEVVKEIKPEAIFFDSFGQAVGDDMNSPLVVNKVFKYVKKTLAVEYNTFVWFVHHTRKAQQGNRKPKNLDDLFGSRYITANVDTGICLWPAGNEIEVLPLKTRLAAKSKDTMFIRRTKDIDFVSTRVRETPVIKQSEGDDDIFSF